MRVPNTPVFMFTNVLVGFFITIPFYYDIVAQKFILHRWFDEPYFGTNGHIPLPIGALPFICAFAFNMRAKHLATLFNFLPIIVLCLFLWMDTGLHSLAFLVLIIAARVLLVHPEILRLPSFVILGWCLGMLVQLVLITYENFLLLNFFSAEDMNLTIKPDLASLFGYQIYSFLVTYSATAAITCVFIILLIIKKYGALPGFLVGGLISIPVIIASRKAAMLDWAALALFSFWFFIKSLPRLNLSLGAASLIGLSIGVLHYVNGSFSRNYSFVHSYEQRSSPYYEFFEEMMTSDLFDLFFGFESGFGGYSNILIDLFTRAGVLGVLAMFLFIVLPAANVIKNIYFGCDTYGKVALLCVVNNVITGNLFNLNLTQPYYVINLILLTSAISYFFGFPKNANTNL